jgi:hypothetical protein
MDKFTSYGSAIGTDDRDDIETIASIPKISNKTPQQTSTKPSKFSMSYIFLGIVVVVVVMVGLVNTDPSQVKLTSLLANLPKPLSSTESLKPFDFTMKRAGYKPIPALTGESADYMKYSILSAHRAVIEPHADMMLHVPDADSSSDDFYNYKICSTKYTNMCSRGSLKPSSGESSSVKIACAPQETYTIEVRKYSINNEVLGQESGTALCMYVRREIRSLTEQDLEATMDAMHALYTHSDEEGQALYGSNFRSSNYLLQIHYFNAAWQDGDHIHEGNGFLPQHIKLTNIFESAMQAVDPSVSLPYWDFTIESAQNLQIYESPIFSAKMFGSLKRATDPYWGWTYKNDDILSAAISDGRWANLPADRNSMFPDLNYAYGYLRAPWSMNPSPYLSRFTSNNKQVPTCSSHADLLDYDRLADFFFMSPYAAHAPTHGSIGGVYGCDLFDPLREAGYILSEDAQVNLCKNWIFYLKEFFRSNYVQPKTACDASSASVMTLIPGKDRLDVDTLSCGFICDSSRDKELVFALKNILNSDNECVPSDMDNKGWFAWKDFICDGDGYKIFGGDHLESASAADPSFWPIHPTLERLLHAKLLSGGFASTRWAEDASQEYVCDKASCYDSELGFGFWDSCCYGHFKDDQYLDPASGSRNSYTGLKNGEVMEMSDASSTDYSMPYLYDHFDYSHCLAQGVDFNAKFESLQTQRQERLNMSAEELQAYIASKSKIQSSTGGLKDKVNDKVGTNMYDPSIGVSDTNAKATGAGSSVNNKQQGSGKQQGQGPQKNVPKR